MLERELTAQTGEIQKQLPYGFFWFRLADTGTKGRSAHKPGFDGLLCSESKIWVVEVKIGKGKKLTDKEEACAKLLTRHNINYFILTYYPDEDFWLIKIYASILTCSGTLLDVCSWLLDL